MGGYSLSQKAAGFIFAVTLASLVWWSTKIVDRVVTIMIGGMVITFFMSVSGLTFNADLATLFNSQSVEPSSSYFPFIFSAFPFCLASFGNLTSIPIIEKFLLTCDF